MPRISRTKPGEPKIYNIQLIIKGSDWSKVEFRSEDLNGDQIFRLSEFLFSLIKEKETGIPASCSPMGSHKE